MASVVIPTARLDLVLQTPEEALAWVEAMDPADRAEMSPDWIARVRSTLPGDPWALGYTAVERVGGATVGACAFKGPPDADGVVEVVYGIDPDHRGRGLATEAAGALAGFAFASGLVRTVRAHTRLDNPASIRVLEKCGFRRLGEIMDPEDGLVVRWEWGQTGSESTARAAPCEYPAMDLTGWSTGSASQPAQDGSASGTTSIESGTWIRSPSRSK